MSTLEDAVLGKAIREMADTAELGEVGGARAGWVFTIALYKDHWSVTARHGDYQRDDEDPEPDFMHGRGATLAEAIANCRARMTKEVAADG